MTTTPKTAIHWGIAHRVDPPPEPKGADLQFTPDFPVTSTTDGGGQLLTNVEVILCFWGSFWSTNPAPVPSSNEYISLFTGIVTGPFTSGLRQYRGVAQGTVTYSEIYAGTDPANVYTDANVVTMLESRFQNSSMPPPAAGHQRFYAVITAPGKTNSLSQFVGQHQSFTYNGVTSWYAWVESNGSLTGFSATKIFSHEFVEACTNPNVNTLNNGITVNNPNNEIGDVCNNQYATVEINGTPCSVQAYWSAADNACILPLGSLSFIVNKNIFGLDEVKEALKTNGVFSNAFWLALDDYSINTFNSFQVAIPTPTGPFANLAGVTISLTPATAASPNPVYEDPNNLTEIQRIRFSFDVKFANPLVTPFPGNGGQTYALTANFTNANVVVPGINSTDTINFELVAGQDPYFNNIDITDAQAVAYLSQDLRVFTITQTQSALPGDPNAPVFLNSQTPYAYMQQLLAYLNQTAAYTTPVPATAPDPLNGLAGQQGYETGESSVTPLDPSGNQNYNFAIARVRLTSDVQGQPGEASNVRVFFRLWVAPSFDTDFQPYTTYLSNPGYPAAPANPLASAANLPPDPTGQAIQTTPFFATDSTGSNDYNPAIPNNNIQTLQIPVAPGRDSVWAYYGCFLDVYDAANNCSYPGTHHCLVAQIAYDGAPIIYSSNVAANPGNIDKLAQRNLQITLSGNPGPKSTHRIPQAFDTRPSPQILDAAGKVLNIPDELMIDWGNIPAGSVAHIYWPQVAAADVLALTARFHGTDFLTATDNHTISCNVVKGVTYIPIPPAQGQNFAGLLTVDLPLGVRKGQEFSILVRRVATKQLDDVTLAAPQRSRRWRYVTGAFQIKIPVTTEAALLGPEENTLAIFKARLAAMAPVYRWVPVLRRSIEVVSGRVNGSGGHAGDIPPSLHGYLPKKPSHPGHPEGGHGGFHDDEDAHTGKICGLVFDQFGDFEGFLLSTEAGEHRFFSRERDMRDLVEGAWRERLRVTVRTRRDEPHLPHSIVLHDPPALFGK